MSYKLKAIISASGLFLMPTGCFTTCFIRGTRVHTPSGMKAIETLKVGDEVWSWDIERHQPVRRNIVRLFRGESTSTFRIQAGEFVIQGVTGEHPLWNPTEQRWIKSKNLSVGDTVLGWPGRDTAKALTISDIQPQQAAEAQPVYTLGVNGDEHNYFAEGVLAHNKTIFNPDGPSDNAFPTCVKVEDGDKLVDFEDVYVGEDHTVNVKLIPNPDCFGRLDGDELMGEMDNPDGVFFIEGGLDISFEDFMRSDGHLLELGFEPSAEGEFEAQLRIGFPTTFDEEIQQDLILQIFGTGVANIDPSDED